MWHHVDCALKIKAALSLPSADHIHYFSELRWSDQEKIRTKFDKFVTANAGSSLAGRTEGLQVEYAKSGKSKCKGCEQLIDKGLVRLAFLLDSGGLYGPAPAWHHIDCFFEYHRDKACNLDDFAGSTHLLDEDRDILRSLMEKNAAELQKDTVEVALPEPEKADRKPSPALLNALKNQNNIVWQFKDAISSDLSNLTVKARKAALEEMLTVNRISIDKMDHELLNVVVDCLTFGCAQICTECKKTRHVWDSESGSYKCPGNEAWGKCGGSLEWNHAKLGSFSIPETLDLPNVVKLGPKTMKRVLRRADKVSEQKIMTSDELADIKHKNRGDDGTQTENTREEKRRKVTIKGRTDVDPDSELETTHHVLEDKKSGKTYSAMLSAADVVSNRNSYYRLQVLEGDWVNSIVTKKKKGGSGSANYYLFRSWGRVGTSIGGSKTERCENRDEAIECFNDHFREKTGNEFDAQPLVKKPKMFFPLDIDLPSVELLPATKPGSKTKLSEPVQSLLKMIFDVEAMRRVMLEMDIDLSKLPLGNISKNQLKQGYEVLTQALTIVQSDRDHAKLNGLSNHFFTLIPHDFGRKRTPLLDNEAIIKAKLDMLEALMEMEVATTIINHGLDIKGHEDCDPLDLHYQSLSVQITSVDPESIVFKNLQKAIITTHAPTHTEYSLKLVNVFEVVRHGELEKYRQNIELDTRLASHRRLLWHGSRTTNFVGILSQGLRIAPPEAPVTGYMFGKGVYFADMVSKSANYCSATPADPEGLLVLSEVALGEMHELTESEYIEKLPTGKSSVKGCGMAIPSKTMPIESVCGGVEESENTAPVRATRSRKKAQATTQVSTVDLSLGPIKSALTEKSELLYNEYIVYNPDQVCMRFLCHVKFEYKE